jgi:CHAT domain-containing protein/Tfp pilus assembly protein PilF
MILSRIRVVCIALSLTLQLCAFPSPAQESRWKDLSAQASDLYHQGKTADAIPIVAEALKVAEAAFGSDDPRVATTLNNLSVLYKELGKYADAEPLQKRALRIHEKTLDPEDDKVAIDLNNLGELYSDLGRYADAEPLFQRALRIREKAFGPEDPKVATTLGSLAGVYDDQSQYAKAEPLFQRALRIDEKTLGADDPDVASDLNSLAGLYCHQGRYSDAEPLFLRSLHIREKALGPDDPDVATALNNLAVLYRDQARFAEAESNSKRALSIDEKAFGADHPNVATDLNNLAAIYESQGKFDDAEPLYKRALSIYENTFGKDHPVVATALNNLAALYDEQSKYGDAEQLYKRALGIHENALGSAHPNVANDLNNLAFLYYREGTYDKAEPLFKQALKIHESALGLDHPNVATDLNNLALLYDGIENYAEAAPFYQRAFDNLFQQFQYNFAYMTEKERLGFLDTVGADFPAYFSFVYRFHEKDPRLAGSMYNVLLWEKGFIAGSVADMRRHVEASGDAEALKLLAQLTEKRSQIAALLNTEPPDRDLWRKQIDQLRTEANDIEKSLVARSSTFAEHTKLERATWQQVRDALQPGEAAVEFARFHYYDKKWLDTGYYVALVVTRETKDQPEYIFLGDSKQIEGDAFTSFEHLDQERGFIEEPEAKLPGEQAYDLIWKPLEETLAGKTRVYLSPDGVLNQLPLGIIPAPGGKMQMEKYDLRLLSSTRDILRSAAPHTGATSLLVGDPVFDLTEDQQRAAIRKLALPTRELPVEVTALSTIDYARDFGSGTTLRRLPGTGAEVAAIAALMEQRQWKASVYTGELALKRVVEGVSSPRVVHLATHGFFLPDQPINVQQLKVQQLKAGRLGLDENQPSGVEDPMLRSGLYFTGANRTLAGNPLADGLDNGVLTAMEAGNLNLGGTELVVLSACDTGQGDVKNGEGVFGLRRALQEAGAQEVLMSLWSVPDAETLDLMKGFYTKWLAGTEIHEALKQAQLEMREKVKAAHDGRDLPYYWGAFVLVGR